MSNVRAYRAALVHFSDDPRAAGPEACIHHPDGLLLVEDGHVAACGDWRTLSATLPADVPVEHLPGRLLTPGFVDAHVHFPQTDMIGAPSGQLLDWLETRTFPTERAFADLAHARDTAKAFVAELLRNGTTTALVFGSVHRAATEALFEAADGLDMRLIAGKSLMDLGPEGLNETVEAGRADTEALIRDWSRRGRLGYAVTPRYALSSTPAQLEDAGRILARHDHVWMQTHLAENPGEVRLVGQAYPDACDYLDVYDRFGLVGPRSVFAHAVHMTDRSLHRMAKAGAAIAHCPTSNLFLGSGLYDLARVDAHGVRTGLGTDIGAGTSFSILSTAGCACQVAKLRGGALDPVRALYLATLGGARTLGLNDRIGSFRPGAEADFVALDPGATPLMARRTAGVSDLADLLSALMILGDDRAVARTWIAGRVAHDRG
ncbi:guanine deaminase [Caulobacter mirabilis]|uniref:Guanine deaminase n=1 Tax=Caulobacter mirabilis TaxID=69666 RepID=A0A2D2B2S1_9CAUL|nr:guanine deaminase [Caulobacter mirabilis]ATQ44553.1 guanine deaminase [Caulobacter mirabilis]